MSTNPLSLGPVHQSDRIQSVDVIRGIALLGILLMNIAGMALPFAYSNPANSGGSTGLNFQVWQMNELFFEGTMRGLFTMLFGAGMVLLTLKGEEKGGGIKVADIYYRRLLWLLLFGLIHAYVLLWYGEILFNYALLGLMLFPLRKTRPFPLLVAGILILILGSFVSVNQYNDSLEAKNQATLAIDLKEEGKTLTEEQEADIKAWSSKQEAATKTPAQIEEEIQQRTGSYGEAFSNNAKKAKYMHTIFLYDYAFWDIMGMMLIGMACFKWGIFQARLSNKIYGLMILVGYGIGLSVNYFELNLITSSNFSLLAFHQAEQTYQLGRFFMVMGHVGVAMLFIKSGILSFLQRSLAAVGRMALTNYISHTVFAILIFSGIGFGLFGQLERYQLYYVVLGIWIFQLVVSSVWLRYFYFGPLEWAWRSLTYKKFQKFRKKDKDNKPEIEADVLPRYEPLAPA